MIKKEEGETHQDYIGDGVYVSWDGYQIVLRTEREGFGVHEIALDTRTFRNLIDYNKRLTKDLEQKAF